MSDKRLEKGSSKIALGGNGEELNEKRKKEIAHRFLIIFLVKGYLIKELRWQ